ncbi:indolepyruvate oxidoreductase subunit beta family protein [Providencia rettgeri]|uniref:Indolepyruvate oxidoreductase subunit beta family protein n=1 Tax=Providencia rettgeri TaxID=587 RepID=A0AAW6UKU1_PRORE|nr:MULTISPECIES: indolepyruvate oxidoreductase subunit beta family protein [Providencia]MBG5893703.1 indolepyruvate oxidoreductase subunit beta family protein [Providencia rettgeri]MBQ0530748.1 indolepyruvate oxidoreductase subunit beta family protein [Providencia rettgeri]MDI9093341.1 indolepyruvate oxidoreductase subunit beta family protein [Providencia rettgeri]MDT2036795.1 indolepyruvate oxidoreductase subunit beta family protein [Providencia rettgeri]WOB86768.1 indolepyruvate oxidoreducta
MNSLSTALPSTKVALQPIKIAILAMGGEGGGVLADWVVNLGEENGYFAQTTSVPGVAQRTGATIYYVELFPGADNPQTPSPVLALMPMPGDVDVVLASELMEAGRAVQRGFVTPERTTLISSTHRVYSIAEKSAMGDGRVDSQALIRHTAASARQFIHFDMAQAAQESGSVISAVLFGALFGSGVLPFSRAQFEETIVRGGVGVKPSLRAFTLGAEKAAKPEDAYQPESTKNTVYSPKNKQVSQLLARIQHEFSPHVQYLVTEGTRRLIDYQDPAYATLYLDRLNNLFAQDGGQDERLQRALARHLALWMSYEDTIRVADLKIRDSRFSRVRNEVQAKDNQLLEINEFMHPRIEEICETLPKNLGRWLMRPHWLHKALRKMTEKGRTITTSSLLGFLQLYLLAAWRKGRRSTLRYQLETQRIEKWLAVVIEAAKANPALATEITQCQRVVKGYSDTHARGLRNFKILMDIVAQQGNKLAPINLRELREAALADEHGKELEKCRQRLAMN